MKEDIDDSYLQPFQHRKWEDAVDNLDLINLLNLYFSESKLWNSNNPQILQNDVLESMISHFSSLPDLVKLDFIVCFPYLVFHENPDQYYILSTISEILFENADGYVIRLAEDFKMKLLHSDVAAKHYIIKLKHCELICATVEKVPPSYMILIEKVIVCLNNILAEVHTEKQTALGVEDNGEENLHLLGSGWVEYEEVLQCDQDFVERLELEQDMILEEMELVEDLEYVQEELVEDSGMYYEEEIIQNIVHEEDPVPFTEIIKNDQIGPGVKISSNSGMVPETKVIQRTRLKNRVKKPKQEIEPLPVLEKQCTYSKSQQNLILARDERMSKRQARILENEEKEKKEMAKIREIIAREEQNYRNRLAEQQSINANNLDKSGSGFLGNTNKKNRPRKKRDYRKEAERRRARKEALAMDLVHTMAPGGGFEVLLDSNGVPVKRPPTDSLSPKMSSQPPLCLKTGKRDALSGNQNEPENISDGNNDENVRNFARDTNNLPQKVAIQEQLNHMRQPDDAQLFEFVGTNATRIEKKRLVKIPFGRSGTQERQSRRSPQKPYAIPKRTSGSRVITLSKGDVQAISSNGSLLIRPIVDENGTTSYRVVPQSVITDTGIYLPRMDNNTSPIEYDVRNRQSELFREGNQVIHPVTLVPRTKVEQSCVMKKSEMIPVAELRLDSFEIQKNDLDNPLHQVYPVQTVSHEEVIEVNQKTYEMCEGIQGNEQNEASNEKASVDVKNGFDKHGDREQTMQMGTWSETECKKEPLECLFDVGDVELEEMSFKPQLDGNGFYVHGTVNKEVIVHNDMAMKHYRVTEEEYAELQETLPDLFGSLPESPEQLEDRYMMVAFIFGRLANPCPTQSNIYTIQLYERTEPIMIDDYETKQVIQMHFEMDFEHVQWTRMRKTYVHHREGVYETIEYLNEPENVDYVMTEDTNQLDY